MCGQSGIDPCQWMTRVSFRDYVFHANITLHENVLNASLNTIKIITALV